MKKIHLIGIDCQMDFCTPPDTYKGIKTGALYVPGADDDMKRLTVFVRRLRDKLADIHVTLDQHHLMDGSHPLYWKNSKGEHPAPFTIITTSDQKRGIWTPVIPSYGSRSIKYTEALEGNGDPSKQRYPLCIWPPHCLIGSAGAAIVPELMDALNDWAQTRKATIDFVTKGSNIFTEHYSAVRAEVPDPADPTTQLNTDFINTIEQADELVWAGEAASHCVANSARDSFNAFGADSIKKSILLTDCMSSVPGFENEFTKFLKEFEPKGLRVSTSVDYLA